MLRSSLSWFSTHPTCCHLPAGGNCTAWGMGEPSFRLLKGCPALPRLSQIPGDSRRSGRPGAGSEPLAHCEPLDKALYPSLSFPICKMRELASMISKGPILLEDSVAYVFTGISWGKRGCIVRRDRSLSASQRCCANYSKCFLVTYYVSATVLDIYILYLNSCDNSKR